MALQVLYQVELVGADTDRAFETVASLCEGEQKDGQRAMARDYAGRLVEAVRKSASSLDDELSACVTTDWNYARLGLLERIILRMAAVEISTFDDVPCRVSIDEAVELGKVFIGPEAGRLINGILHRYASGKDPAGLAEPARKR